MNAPTTITEGHEPLAVEMLATNDQRRLHEALDAHRPITVADHQRFRQSIQRPTDFFDQIDKFVADAPGPLQMRNSREVARLLSILDELETGKDGHE